MAIIAEGRLSETTKNTRFDAEFFANPYLPFLERMFSKWDQWVSLRDTAQRLTSGHTPLRHDVDTGDCPFITVECVDALTLNMNKAKRVWQHHVDGELRRVKLKKGDVLITIKRRIANSCPIFEQPVTTAVNQDVAVLTPKPGFLAGYLAAVMCSRIGKYQAQRQQTEQINPYISVGSLGTLLVPVVDTATQAEIEDAIRGVHTTLADADSAYAEVESLLESALGLDKLDLTPRLFYERPYSDLQATARFDAEYFSPRMQNLIAALSRDNLTITDVAKESKRCFKPKPGTEFQYIEIGDVFGSGSADSNPVAGEEAPSRATWIVKPGDIITTTVRPIRRLSSIIADDQDGYVCSSGFAVLTPRNPKDTPPELLLVYLRLPLVCELLDLYTTASMYPAISTPDLMKIPIALPDDATRQKIVSKIRDSFDARRDARRLLDEAKAMVEKAIFGESDN